LERIDSIQYSNTPFLICALAFSVFMAVIIV
jgi:hypothetical protein